MNSSSPSSTETTPNGRPTSTGGSPMPSVKRAAVVTIERDGDDAGDALKRLRAVATQHGVELVDGDDADIAIVLGGDGTMLRALARFLGTGIPVIGVNYGRVGFLTAIHADELEAGVARGFPGEYPWIEVSTLAASVNGTAQAATHHAALPGGAPRRMGEDGYSSAAA